MNMLEMLEEKCHISYKHNFFEPGISSWLSCSYWIITGEKAMVRKYAGLFT